MGQLYTLEALACASSYTPTPKALEFYASGLNARQRMILGAVRSRKTTIALKEVACHVTGIYPRWWNGYKFSYPNDWLVATVKAEKTRDVLQRYLLDGDPRYNLHPFIHQSLIVGEQRKHGVPDMFSRVFVQHISGGVSSVRFASYGDGATNVQSDTLQGVLLDETPPYDFFSETALRTTKIESPNVVFSTKKKSDDTFVLLTMWPSRGMDELVCSFYNKTTAGVATDSHFFMHCSWADNPSLTEAEKERMRSVTPEYLLEAREFGIPTFGRGRVFRMKVEELIVPAFLEIPRTFAMVYGLDPAATSGGTYGACLLAHDRDNDIVYVVKDYKKNNITPIEHHQNLLNIFPDGLVGVADPAGGGEDQHNRESTLDFFRRMGRVLVKAEKGKNKKESTVDDIEIRIRSGKFKICDNCRMFLDEWRQYSRDEDGKIIKQNDHIMDACFYALSGLKYAKPALDTLENEWYNNVTNRLGVM